MAQADSVPSSSRQLITVERANQSTNLRAVKLPAVSIQPVDRHYFIGGSDARGIVDGVPLLWIWRERRPLILLRFRSRNKRLRFSAFDGVPSNQPIEVTGRLR